MHWRSMINKTYKLSYLVLVICTIAAAYYVSENWFQVSLIRGESMSPAYHNMQLVLLNRYSDDYTYGDVIAFQCEGLDSVLVKRIAACPGDQVIIIDGTMYVNNTISSVFPQEHVFNYAGIAEDSIELKENQYFVIGDNLKESKDSRYEDVGVVCKDDFCGRVIPQNPRNQLNLCENLFIHHGIIVLSCV